MWHLVVLQEMLLLLTHKNIFDFDSMDRAVLARKMYRFCHRYKLLALWSTLAIGRHLLGVQLVRSLKSNAADTPALWLNVFLTGTHLLLVMNIKWSDFLFTTIVNVRVFLVSWQQ